MSNPLNCPCCGHLNTHTSRFTVTTSRNKSSWTTCEKCNAYFLAEEYQFEKEVSHTANTAWGMEDSGVKLNNYKGRMFNAITDKLATLKPGASLLDIGTSYGGFSIVARSKGFKVECTDIVPAAINYVSSLGFPAYICYSVKDLPKEKKYDIVCAIDCNMYWPDQAHEFEHIRERINDNGLFVMRVVSKHWMVRAGLLIRNIVPSLGEKIIARALNDHRHSMPPASLVKLLKEKKFTLIHQSINEAIHSYDASAGVKFSFFAGNIIYKLSGSYITPGVFFVFRKEA